jgi:hypothetical protein
MTPARFAPALALLMCVAACTSAPHVTPSATPPSGSPSSSGTPSRDPVIAAAGDIACSPGGRTSSTACRQGSTAAMLARGGFDAILALGDDQYEAGSLRDYRRGYGPAWGRFKAVTYPVPGNHEYGTSGAAGYYAYFGARAGDPAKGYYSFDIGAWHLIALNSNCSAIGGCGASSLQVKWLHADLASHRSACTLAYWHHPRFSSGIHGDDNAYDAFWRALYAAGADLVLVGHDHDYERFAPQTPGAEADPARGIREFVVGTGGRSVYPFLFARPNSQVRHSGTFGVLGLTLHPRGYDWRFEGVAGSTFSDSGSDMCH